MPVERFEDPEAARLALRVERGPALWRRIRNLWARSAQLAPQSFQERGVRRFRSIEEANTHKQEAIAARARRSARG